MRIEELREDYNRSILEKKINDVMNFLCHEYTVLPGETGLPLSKDEYKHMLSRAFADPEFETYVRTPSEIFYCASLSRAAESGSWTGTWTKPGGTMQKFGRYQAVWVFRRGQWSLINESFVLLSLGTEIGQSYVQR